MNIPLRIGIAVLMAVAPIPRSVAHGEEARQQAPTSESTEPPSTPNRLDELGFSIDPQHLVEPVSAKSRADEAQERKEAADALALREQEEREAAAKAALAAQARARRVVLASAPVSSSLREYAQKRVLEEFGEGQWDAFDAIVTHESGWNPNAVNASSGACGLGQALPCSKMGSKTPEGQVDWVISYLAERYGNPASAWGFWQAHRWY